MNATPTSCAHDEYSDHPMRRHRSQHEHPVRQGRERRLVPRNGSQVVVGPSQHQRRHAAPDRSCTSPAPGPTATIRRWQTPSRKSLVSPAPAPESRASARTSPCSRTTGMESARCTRSSNTAAPTRPPSAGPASVISCSTTVETCSHIRVAHRVDRCKQVGRPPIARRRPATTGECAASASSSRNSC